MLSLTFDDLVVNHVQELQPFALSLTKDRHAADDLCQETVFKALRFRRSYTDDISMKAWLQTIMRNIFINDYRRRVKRREVLTVIKNGLSHEWSNAESQLAFKEIFRAIHQLPSITRSAYLLYMHGYRYQEIASSLNTRLGTVKSRIHFAKELLGRRLDR